MGTIEGKTGKALIDWNRMLLRQPVIWGSYLPRIIGDAPEAIALPGVLLKPCPFSQSNHINDPSRRIFS